MPHEWAMVAVCPFDCFPGQAPRYEQISLIPALGKLLYNSQTKKAVVVGHSLFHERPGLSKFCV